MTLRSDSRRIEFAIGRVLVGSLFLLGTAQKLLNPGSVQNLLSDHGLPEILIIPAALFNFGAGLCLILNWKIRPVCLLLAAYCMLTSLFHFIPDDGWQMSIFVKNWAIAGGLLCIASLSSPAKILKT